MDDTEKFYYGVNKRLEYFKKYVLEAYITLGEELNLKETKKETLELGMVYTICLLLSSDMVFTLLINGSFGLLFKIRHLNFTTNGCSFFIHLIGETAVFN